SVSERLRYRDKVSGNERADLGPQVIVGLRRGHPETVFMPHGAENQDRATARITDQLEETRGRRLVAVDVICVQVKVQLVEPQDRAWCYPWQFLQQFIRRRRVPQA